MIAPASADETGLSLNRSAGAKSLDEKTLAETGGVFQPEYTLSINGSGALGYEVPILLLRIEVERRPTDACQCFYDCAGMTAGRVAVLQPAPGDCCVCRSYGTVPCPSVQATREA